MSKKLIAVASAAALALSALVAAPASAAGFGAPVITDTTSGKTGSTTTTALEHSLPVDNSIDNDGTADNSNTNTAVRFEYSGLTNGKSINIKAEGSVRLVAETTDEVEAVGGTQTTADGLTSLSVSVVSTGAVFLAYSTSYTPGKVVVSYEGQSLTYYVVAKKHFGNAYSVSTVWPANVGSGAEGEILATVKDPFGNVIGEASNNAAPTTFTLTMGFLGTTATHVGANTEFKWSTAKKAYVGKFTAAATGAPISGTVTLGASLATKESVGFEKPVVVSYGAVAAVDLSAQVKLLEAQVAKMVTKKRYNTLARKWNRAFPSQKVALKK